MTILSMFNKTCITCLILLLILLILLGQFYQLRGNVETAVFENVPIKETTAKDMKHRSQIVHTKCVELARLGYVIKENPAQFRNFPSLGIGWCPVFKAGSSNWKDYLAKILKIDKE